MVSCLTALDSVVSVDTNNTILPYLVKYYPVKLETSCAVILPKMVSVLWSNKNGMLS